MGYLTLTLTFPSSLLLEKEGRGGEKKTGNNVRYENCTKTNTSGWVEYTKAHELNFSKELGKLAPYISNKEFLFFLERGGRESIKSEGELFTKNTIFS